MSWSFDKNTMAVTMHKGDTGAYYATAVRGSRSDWEDGDTAIYEVVQGRTVKIHREFNLQPAVPNDIELGDGKFLISFVNSDTDTWAAGTYTSEIRIARNPKRNVKVSMAVTTAERSGGATAITAEIDEETCLAYVDDTTGTVTLSYTTGWSESPANYGITVTGTPVSGDKITVSWNKDGDGRVVDGDNVRTIIRSSVTINDVIIDI